MDRERNGRDEDGHAAMRPVPAADVAHHQAPDAAPATSLFDTLMHLPLLHGGEQGPAVRYVARRGNEIVAAWRQRLAQMPLPLAPGVAWGHDWAHFVEQLGSAVAASGELYQQLPQWLAGFEDPWNVVDRHRSIRPAAAGAPPVGPVAVWFPDVGQALAQALVEAMRGALWRMSARWAVAQEGEALIPQHPIDKLIVRMMLAPGVLAASKAPAKGARATPSVAEAAVQARGLRALELEFEGERDPQLWNWVRVRGTPDATVEDVAFTLWASDSERSDSEATMQAHALVAAPPLFMVPGAKAIKDERFRKHVRSGFAQRGAFDMAKTLLASTSTDHALSTVMGSADADAVILAQARAAAPGVEGHLASVCDEVAAVLAYLQPLLAPWDVGEFARVQAFVARRRGDADGAWHAVLTGQLALLREVGRDVMTILRSTGEGRGADGEAPRERLMRLLLQVVVASPMGAAAQTYYAHARALVARLPVDMLAYEAHHAQKQALQVQHGARQAGLHTAEATAEVQAATAARDRAVALQGALLAGQPLDGEALGAASLAVAEVAVRTQLTEIRVAVDQLGGALSQVTSGVMGYAASNQRVAALETKLAWVRTRLHELTEQLSLTPDEQRRAELQGDGAASAAYLRARQQQRVHEVSRDLSLLAQGAGLSSEFFQAAYQEVSDVQFRRALWTMASLLAVSLVTAGVGSMVGSAAASGTVLAATRVAQTAEAVVALTEASLAPRLIGGATSIVVDAGLSGVAQSALTGEGLGSMVSENILANLGTLVTMSVLRFGYREVAALDDGVRAGAAAWQANGKTWRMAKHASVASLELVVGAGVGYAVHRAMAEHDGKPVPESTMEEWALQGAAMALGRFIQGRISAQLASMHVEGASPEVAAEVRAVRAQAELLLKQAEVLETRGRPELATKVIHGYQALLGREQALLGTVGSTSELARAHMEAVGELGRPAFVRMQLHLLGATPVVEGADAWLCTPAQLLEAQALLVAAKVKTSQPGPTTLRIEFGEQSLELWTAGPIAPLPKAAATVGVATGTAATPPVAPGGPGAAAASGAVGGWATPMAVPGARVVGLPVGTAWAPSIAPTRYQELLPHLPPEMRGLRMVESGYDDASVAVHYVGGEIVLVVGARATARQVNWESFKVKQLARYHRPLTFVERLLQRAGRLQQRVEQGAPTPEAPVASWMFEASLQLQTLSKVHTELRALQAEVAAGAQHVEAGQVLTVEAINAHLADVELQLVAYQSQLENLELGRGWLETQHGRVRTTVEERLIVPVSAKDLAAHAARDAKAGAAMTAEGHARDAAGFGPRQDTRGPASVAERTRRALVATTVGDMPRYLVRVGPVNPKETFGNPGRNFVFATEYADLEGLGAIDAMLAVGWTKGDIQWVVNEGKVIERIIIDTQVTVDGEMMQVQRVNWPDVRARAMGDAEFLKLAAHENLSPALLQKLFDLVSTGHNTESKAKGKAAGLDNEMDDFLDILKDKYAVNPLYTGEGYTKSETGAVTAHEVMVLHNGTGLKLIPENHSKVNLGKITQAEFDAHFGTGGTP